MAYYTMTLSRYISPIKYKSRVKEKKRCNESWYDVERPHLHAKICEIWIKEVERKIKMKSVFVHTRNNTFQFVTLFRKMSCCLIGCYGVIYKCRPIYNIGPNILWYCASEFFFLKMLTALWFADNHRQSDYDIV